MNVKELKEFLNNCPDDMEILFEQYSDYSVLEGKKITVIKAVIQDWGVMRSHPTMSEENKAKEKEYLLFPGN